MTQPTKRPIILSQLQMAALRKFRMMSARNHRMAPPLNP